MRGLRARHVDDERLLAVADAVAVGVGLRRADHPRVLDRVDIPVGNLAREPILRHHRPSGPGVAPEADLAAIGSGNHVACQIRHAFRSRVGDRAEERVEAMEQLVVVAHVVEVRVPHPRVGGGVADRTQTSAARKTVRRQHDPVARAVAIV